MPADRLPTAEPGSAARLDTEPDTTRPPRGIAPALALVFLAPLVGEYLLGNIPMREIVALIFLAPMYGGGALLIREVTRRAGRGWATILLLGAAYGLVEAGMFDGSLFNRSFEGLDLGSVYIPALGISAYNSLHFVVGHAVWSITIPIALVEAFVPRRRATPWLGNVGLGITAVAYVLGGLFVLSWSRDSGNYQTSLAQFAGTALVVVVLIAIAFCLGRGAPAAVAAKPAPRPLLIGIGAFVASSLFFAAPEDWPGVAFSVAMIAASTFVVVRLSRRTGWGETHRLALAGGTLLTYAWGGFVLTTLKGQAIDYVGNAIFAVGAIVLLAAATYSTVRASRQAS
jgi:hypothetical protein